MSESFWQHLFGHSPAESHSQRQCLMCGDCCRAFGGHLHASEPDLQRWREQGRDDLLQRVSPIGWIWIDPATKRLEDPCPFIVRLDDEHYGCSIHEIKPDICRAYPTLAHGNRCLRGVFL